MMFAIAFAAAASSDWNDLVAKWGVTTTLGSEQGPSGYGDDAAGASQPSANMS